MITGGSKARREQARCVLGVEGQKNGKKKKREIGG